MTGPTKTDGNLKYAQGVVKENVGSLIGNEQMQAEGQAKRAEGNTEYKSAQAKGYAEGAADNVKGSVKNAVGGLIGNDKMQAEGKAKDTKGDMKRAANE